MDELRKIALNFDKLTNKIYRYKLSNSDEIKLIFKNENLSHLIGLEYYANNPKSKGKYKGTRGYKNIKDGKITISNLKANRNIYGLYKNKLKYFSELDKILNAPEIIEFDMNKVTGTCRINVKYVLYTENQNVDIHLGIKNIKGSNKYFPVSFFIAKNSQKSLYIKDQTKLAVLESEIIKIVTAPKKQVVASAKKQVASAPKKQVVASAKKQVASAPKKQVVASAKKQVASAPKKQVVASAKKQVASAPKEQVVASAKKQVASAPKKQIVASAKKRFTTAPKKQITASPIKQVATTKVVSREDINKKIYMNLKKSGEKIGFKQLNPRQIHELIKQKIDFAYFKGKTPGTYNIAFNEKKRQDIEKHLNNLKSLSKVKKNIKR